MFKLVQARPRVSVLALCLCCMCACGGIYAMWGHELTDMGMQGCRGKYAMWRHGRPYKGHTYTHVVCGWCQQAACQPNCRKGRHS